MFALLLLVLVAIAVLLVVRRAQPAVPRPRTPAGRVPAARAAALADWVQAGLLSQAQADAIAEHERALAAAGAATPAGRERHLPPLAEALG